MESVWGLMPFLPAEIEGSLARISLPSHPQGLVHVEAFWKPDSKYQQKPWVCLRGGCLRIGPKRPSAVLVIRRTQSNIRKCYRKGTQAFMFVLIMCSTRDVDPHVLQSVRAFMNLAAMANGGEGAHLVWRVVFFVLSGPALALGHST